MTLRLCHINDMHQCRDVIFARDLGGAEISFDEGGIIPRVDGVMIVSVLNFFKRRVGIALKAFKQCADIFLDRAGREAILAALADQLNAAPIQHIGKLLVLWRPMPPKAVKVDDTPRKPGSRTVKLVTFSKSGSHRAQVKTVTVHGNQRLSAGGKIKRAETRQVSVKKKAQSQ